MSLSDQQLFESILLKLRSLKDSQDPVIVKKVEAMLKAEDALVWRKCIPLHEIVHAHLPPNDL